MWSSDPLGHGYLVLPGAIYLAWTRRDRLRPLTPKPAFWWLPLLGAVSFLWLVAHVTSTTAVQQLSLAFMFVGFIWGTLGTAVAKELAFPLGLLMFAVPLGDYLVPTLQNITAAFAVTLLQVSGVPVLLRSEIISIPGSTWEVATACSGINYLMSALLLAYLYAGFVYRSTMHRIAFFLSAAPVALVANGLRVYITILVAFLGSRVFANGMRHYLVGWVVFGIIVYAMFEVARRFHEEDAADTRREVATLEASVVPRSGLGWTAVAFVTLALAVVGVAPLTASRLLSGKSSGERDEPHAVQVSRPWETLGQDVYPWSLAILVQVQYSRVRYVGGAKPVKLHVSYYSSTERDVEIGSRQPSLSSRGWSAVFTNKRRVTVAGSDVTVNETSLQSQTDSLLVWSWYLGRRNRDVQRLSGQAPARSIEACPPIRRGSLDFGRHGQSARDQRGDRSATLSGSPHTERCGQPPIVPSACAVADLDGNLYRSEAAAATAFRKHDQAVRIHKHKRHHVKSPNSVSRSGHSASRARRGARRRVSRGGPLRRVRRRRRRSRLRARVRGVLRHQVLRRRGERHRRRALRADGVRRGHRAMRW